MLDLDVYSVVSCGLGSAPFDCLVVQSLLLVQQALSFSANLGAAQLLLVEVPVVSFCSEVDT